MVLKYSDAAKQLLVVVPEQVVVISVAVLVAEAKATGTEIIAFKVIANENAINLFNIFFIVITPNSARLAKIISWRY